MLQKTLINIGLLVCFTFSFGYADPSTISIRNKSNPENFADGVLRFIVELDQANNTGYDIIYTFSTSDGSAIAGDDYEAHTNSSVTIPSNGARIRHAIVGIYNDNLVEDDENFTVTITSAYINSPNPQNLTIDPATATGTINNDDTSISVQVRNLTIDPEGTDPGSPGNFQLTRSFIHFDFTKFPGDGFTFELDWDFVNGSAIEGNSQDEDFMEPLDGELTVTSVSNSNPVQSSRREVRIIKDIYGENTEEFYIRINDFKVYNNGQEVSGLSLDTGDDGTVTIIDDDPVDMQVSKTADKDFVQIHDNYTTTIQVSNAGTGWAKAVTVHDNLPAGVSFVSADCGGVFNNGRITWNFNDFQPSDSKVLTVEVTANRLAEGTKLQNVACASCDGDINPENNCDKSAVTVLVPNKTFCCDINSSKNIGIAPVWTTFEYFKPVTTKKWYLAHNIRSRHATPSFIYWKSIYYGDSGKVYEISLAGPVEGCQMYDFIRVYPPGGFGHLSFVDGSNVLKDRTWHNAIDGDVYWYDGTTEALVENGQQPWAIFEFSDQGVRKINKIRMLTDTGIKNLPKQVVNFKVLVSTDGQDYTEVLEAMKSNNVSTPCTFFDDWMEWTIDPVEAKYIKLVLTGDTRYNVFALGEFEVWFENVLADTAQSSLEVNGTSAILSVKDTDGNPISGLTDHDIKVYTYNLEGYGSDPHVTAGQLVGEQDDNPGVYDLTVANYGCTKVSVNGVVISATDTQVAGQAGQNMELQAESDKQIEVTEALPTEFSLFQNFPNPFNPETAIRYQLPEDVYVTLKIYDVQGKEVATLVDGNQNAGSHSVIWHAGQLPSGLYFYQITARQFQAIKRMLYLK